MSSFRRDHPASKGSEVCDVTPVILGGNPSDPGNKAVLSREQHIQYVRYWNAKLAELKAGPAGN